MARYEVDEFVAQLPPGWIRDCCADVVATARGLPGEIDERLRWAYPHFERRRDLFGLSCTDRSVLVFVYRGDELADPDSLFDADSGRGFRTITVTPQRPLDLAAFRRLLNAMVALPA